MSRLLSVLLCALLLPAPSAHAEKMQIGFLWHMHQPVYYPGENINQTEAAHHFSFSLYDIHNQRFGPYTSWPKDAIVTGSGLPNLGASVSFSGSLIENLNAMKNAGVNGGMWNNWNAAYTAARQMTTTLGDPRIDMVGFNYNHALMPLLDIRDMRMQIEMHKVAIQQTFGSSVPYSTGFFPAETAFSERVIPALVAEGFQWSLVDNIHFDRATKNYPHTNSSGLFAPNKADQINPDPAASGGAWIQLSNLWAPSKVSAPFSYRPHNVQYVDPNSGAVSKIVAVPGARYEGNEDGRGGFGALLYQQVMDQYKQYNTDPAHPMLVVLHHDGDNYGGGSDSYYHNNFQNMVNWANGNPDYNVTTVADYLKRFPVAGTDIIHVENGSWAGADNGDAEFKKWLGDPNSSGWSPDRNSWAVLTAAKNRVFTAEDMVGPANVNNVINNTGNGAEKAWHYLAQAESSDHWYWDGTEVWDSNVTRGSNLAVTQADPVIAAHPGVERTPPTVFVPQRDSYNPGTYEFGNTPEPSDFKVWTFAYDVSGLSNVTLKWRTDNDGENPLSSTQNETYAGGGEVGAWQSITMTGANMPTQPSNILAPTYRAQQYSTMITGQSNKLIDYYIEATDGNGNVTKTDIQHVWVGGSTTPPPAGGQFVMDGGLDADAKEIATRNGMHLYYSMHAGKLYVATNDAGEGSDHFIYLAGPSGAGVMVPANWAKGGQVAQWAAYLADENDNSYSSWFDAQGATQNATGPNGGVLEGTIDLAGEFGSIPAQVYLAVGVFATPDGGALYVPAQLPNTLDNDGNIQAAEYLQLVLPQGWAIGGSGDWNTAWNWTAAIPNAVGANAQFLNVIATPATVTTSTAVTVGQITFASPYGYTLSGTGSLKLDVATGSAAINVTAGTNQILLPTTLSDNTTASVAPGTLLRFSGPLTLSSGVTLTSTGGGTVEINGPVTAASGAAIRVNGGVLASSVNLAGAALQCDAGEARLNHDQHLASLGIANAARVTLAQRSALSPGSAHTLYTTTLSIAAGGTLDLNDNDLVVSSGSFSQIRQWVFDGYSAIPNPAKTGIISSTGQSAGNTILALFDNALVGTSEWPPGSGNFIATAAIVGKYTYFGDMDLDGQVTAGDYGVLDANLGSTPLAGLAWVSGDADLDGAVASGDYGILDANLGSGSGAPLEPRSTPVPEPIALAVSALLIFGARRRHQG